MSFPLKRQYTGSFSISASIHTACSYEPCNIRLSTEYVDKLIEFDREEGEEGKEEKEEEFVGVREGEDIAGD